MGNSAQVLANTVQPAIKIEPKIENTANVQSNEIKVIYLVDSSDDENEEKKLAPVASSTAKSDDLN